ncbi:hypothetical protein BH10PSE19_BH10PSE19_09080 [soil metagenome]
MSFDFTFKNNPIPPLGPYQNLDAETIGHLNKILKKLWKVVEDRFGNESYANAFDNATHCLNLLKKMPEDVTPSQVSGWIKRQVSLAPASVWPTTASDLKGASVLKNRPELQKDINAIHAAEAHRATIETARAAVGALVVSPMIMTGFSAQGNVPGSTRSIAKPLTLEEENRRSLSDEEAADGKQIFPRDAKRAGLTWDNVVSNGTAIRVADIVTMPLMGVQCKGSITEGKLEGKAEAKEAANNPYNFHESDAQYQARLYRVAFKLAQEARGPQDERRAFSNPANIVCGQQAPGTADGKLHPEFVKALIIAGFGSSEWIYDYQPKSSTEGQLTLIRKSAGLTLIKSLPPLDKYSAKLSNGTLLCPYSRFQIKERDGLSYDLANINLDPEDKEAETQLAHFNLESRSMVVVGNTGRHVEAVDAQLQAQSNRYLMFRPSEADQLFQDEATGHKRMKSTHMVMYNATMLRNHRQAKVARLLELDSKMIARLDTTPRYNVPGGAVDLRHRPSLLEHARNAVVNALWDKHAALENELKLITDDERPRAVSKAFWARFNNKVDKIDAKIKQKKIEIAQLKYQIDGKNPNAEDKEAVDHTVALVSCNSDRALVEKVAFMGGPAKAYFDSLNRASTEDLSLEERNAKAYLEDIQRQACLLFASQTYFPPIPPAVRVGALQLEVELKAVRQREKALNITRGEVSLLDASTSLLNLAEERDMARLRSIPPLLLLGGEAQLTAELAEYRDIVCNALDAFATIYPAHNKDVQAFLQILKRSDITIVECAALIRAAYTNSPQHYSFHTALVRMGIGMPLKGEEKESALLNRNLPRAIQALLGDAKAMAEPKVVDAMSRDMKNLFEQLQDAVSDLNPWHGELINGAAYCEADLKHVSRMTDIQFKAWLTINMESPRYSEVWKDVDVSRICKAVLAAVPAPALSTATTDESTALLEKKSQEPYSKLSKSTRDQVLQLIDAAKQLKTTGWWDQVEGATKFCDFLTSKAMQGKDDAGFKRALSSNDRAHKPFILKCGASREVGVPRVAALYNLVIAPPAPAPQPGNASTPGRVAPPRRTDTPSGADRGADSRVTHDSTPEPALVRSPASGSGASGGAGPSDSGGTPRVSPRSPTAPPLHTVVTSATSGSSSRRDALRTLNANNRVAATTMRH